MRPVSESTRISVTARLEEFRDGTEPEMTFEADLSNHGQGCGARAEMTFEADLSNHDRAVVHELCRKMGFVSRKPRVDHSKAAAAADNGVSGGDNAGNGASPGGADTTGKAAAAADNGVSGGDNAGNGASPGGADCGGDGITQKRQSLTHHGISGGDNGAIEQHQVVLIWGDGVRQDQPSRLKTRLISCGVKGKPLHVPVICTNGVACCAALWAGGPPLHSLILPTTPAFPASPTPSTVPRAAAPPCGAGGALASCSPPLPSSTVSSPSFLLSPFLPLFPRSPLSLPLLLQWPEDSSGERGEDRSNSGYQIRLESKGQPLTRPIWLCTNGVLLALPRGIVWPLPSHLAITARPSNAFSLSFLPCLPFHPTVAERIAAERGDGIGKQSGTRSGWSRRATRSSSLWLCTNGVLLRCLVGFGREDSCRRGEGIGKSRGTRSGWSRRATAPRPFWLCTNGVLLRRLVGLGAHLHSREGWRGAQGGGGGGGGGRGSVGSGGGSGEGGGGSIVEPGLEMAIAAAVKGMAEGVTGEGEGERGRGRRGKEWGGGEGGGEGGIGREVDADVLAKLDATHIIVDENLVLSPRAHIMLTSSSPPPALPQFSTSCLICKGRAEEVEMLLSLGADVTLTSDEGSTALDWARMYGHEAVCRILERHMEALGLGMPEEGEEKQRGWQHRSKWRSLYTKRLWIMMRLKEKSYDAHTNVSTLQVGGRGPGKGVVGGLMGGLAAFQTPQNAAREGRAEDGAAAVEAPLKGRGGGLLGLQNHCAPVPGQSKAVQTRVVLPPLFTPITLSSLFLLTPPRPRRSVGCPKLVRASGGEGQGGCRPGVCFHLFSRTRAGSLPGISGAGNQTHAPEELCLQ
ncbi:unnamed protein product, partial [Closterium sp. NIES-64]